MAALVKNPNQIRLAMVGMVAENGHPYSWSAIFNGFDANVMAHSPYPVINKYLCAQPKHAFGIENARVTHIWCDDPADARRVAAATLIPNVVRHPLDVIENVDAVIIPTDIGDEHLERARPFIEAGLPVFIDKPLTTREEHLRLFAQWQREGKPIFSSSCMRYCRKYAECGERIASIGDIRLITMTMYKSWERYGIHALEGVYPFLTAGRWLSVTNSGAAGADIVHVRHESGTSVVLASISDMYGAFGFLNVHGTKGSLSARFENTFAAFKAQLAAFVKYLQTGKLPFSFEETVEQMKIVIATIRSREEGGRKVALPEIKV